MYGIDLGQISLEEFETIIANTELLPGRRMLVDNLGAVVARLQANGAASLADVQAMLRNKKRYAALAETLSVTVEYLTILNREINSYVVKPVPLAKLDVFTAEELDRFTDAGLKSTRDLYEAGLTPAARADLAARLELSPEKLTTALELADLLRINGVGPVYAQFLRQLGLCSPAVYLATASDDILVRFQRASAEAGTSTTALGLKDVEYCKRFCAKLDADIVW